MSSPMPCTEEKSKASSAFVMNSPIFCGARSLVASLRAAEAGEVDGEDVELLREPAPYRGEGEDALRPRAEEDDLLAAPASRVANLEAVDGLPGNVERRLFSSHLHASVSRARREHNGRTSLRNARVSSCARIAKNQRDSSIRACGTIVAMAAVGALEPWTNTMRLDHTSTMASHRYADRFSVVRVETVGARPAPIRKSSSVPALLVSVFVRPLAPMAIGSGSTGRACRWERSRRSARTSSISRPRPRCGEQPASTTFTFMCAAASSKTPPATSATGTSARFDSRFATRMPSWRRWRRSCCLR